MNKVDDTAQRNEIKLLLVDDNHTNMDILRKALEPEGYSISVAPSGEVALKIAPRFLPDLILLDIMMPGIDGFETCRRLKKNDQTRDIPIIFITARSDTDDIVAGFRIGGVDYITKPFSHEEVCVRVRTHIQIRILMRQLENRNRKCAELNEMKTVFLAIVAHDLRNPLISIQGFANLLLKKIDRLNHVECLRYLSTINAASHEMLNLVNNLLDVMVIENGKLEITPTQGLLLDLVRKRIEINRVIADKKLISIKLESEVSGETIFDYNRIAQVLDNLLANAIKFSPRKSNVYINMSKHKNEVMISVRDEGPGISEEDLRNICKKFQKLSAMPTEGEKSTGLGLTIAKKMIDAHKGRLEIKSRPGCGSTFTFTIPLNLLDSGNNG